MGYQQKSYKKFVATAATATLVASAIVPVASAAGFSDVPADNEFATYINALVDQGIINGYASDNTFRPGNKLTRGQVAIMLGRWLENNGATVPADWATNSRFEDVSSSNEELAKYAALVKDAGVFTGVNGKLNPSQNITRENMAVVLDRVAEEVAGVSLVELAKEIEDVKVEDLATAQTAYQEQIQALADLKITTVSNFRPKEQLTRAQFAKFLYTSIEIIEEAAATPTEVAVESVTAVNSKTLEVKFNTKIAASASDFTVTKGSVKANIASVSISEDGKTAQIELTSKLTEGTYTVNVAQKDAEALTGEVKVENEKVSAIKILSDVAPFKTTDKTEATVTAQVLNQYGEDITKLNYSDVTVTASGTATGAKLAADGTLTITLPSGSTAKEDDKVILTLVHAKTGVSTQKTVTLSSVASISEITFGELYNKDGKSLSQDTDLSKDKFYLPVTTKDQYGNDVTDASKISDEVLFTNTNQGVVTFGENVKAVTINGKEVNVLEVTGVNLAGTANLIAVSKTSGKSTTTSVTVAEGVKIGSVTLSSPTEILSANKDAYFPLNVVDSNGNEIKTLKALNAIKQDELSVSSDYEIVELDDKEGLFVEVPANAVKEGKAVTVVVTSKSGKVSTQTMVAKAEAVPTVITGLNSKISTSLRANQEGVTIQNTNLVVEDQYGQVITDETVLATIKFKASVEEGTASENAFDLTNNDTSVVVAPKANTTETTGKVTFKLLVDSKEVESSALTKTFSIISDSQFASYAVEDVKTIYAPKTNTTDTTGTVSDAYDQDIVVKATTTSGEVVTLKEGTDYTVTGKNDTVDYGDTTATTAKQTVTITINATGEELTKELTYSNVAPKVAKVQLVKNNSVVDEEDGTAIKITSSTKIEEVKSVEFTGGAAFNYDSLVDLVDMVVTDTYGNKVAAAEDTDSFVVTLGDDKVTVTETLTFTKVTDEVGFTSNGTAEAAVTEYIVGSEFNTLVKLNGVSANTVKVTVKTAGYSATGEANAEAEAQKAVNDEAAKITAEGITNLADGANVLTQAQALVAEGYEVTITASENSAIANGTGVVTQPESSGDDVTGNVTFTVTKDGKTATAVVSLTVVKKAI